MRFASPECLWLLALLPLMALGAIWAHARRKRALGRFAGGIRRASRFTDTVSGHRRAIKQLLLYFALASLVTMPLLAYFVGEPAVVAPACGVMLLLTLGKRLEANRRPLPPPGPERRRVILRRLFLDRDMASHSDWIRRRPEDEDEG